ncbi:hypothetical protein ABZ446_28560 [Streptomyces sp. NPDC005813]|uniref:hypothetical protein n=1 Tax=Streptomyces sp. NPDC005813 TaxID=3155592 RepID=UPI0034018451
MAVNVSLNTPEVWRSVVGYQSRKRNPDYHWRDNRDVPQHLDEYHDEIQHDVRGPYTDETAARIQAGRDASSRSARYAMSRVVFVTVESSGLAWQECGRRDPETKKWEAVE